MRGNTWAISRRSWRNPEPTRDEMDHVVGLRCVLCGEEYSAHEVLYVCPKHGYEGILDVQYDYELIGKRLTKEGLGKNPDHSIWRYKPLLPVDAESPIPPLQVGWTPLYQAQRLGQKLGLSNLYLKDEGRNPTASLKDRASAIGVVKAQELGKEIITCIFGAQVIMVKGTYDQAFDLCLEASDEFGWYSRNTAYNPYLSEGKKTAALEVCEQLSWQAPDRVFVSVGDGCIIGGLHKGFKDLLALWAYKRTGRLL